jgi:hypothetical protein
MQKQKRSNKFVRPFNHVLNSNFVKTYTEHDNRYKII